jgi:hypothetical protein
VDVGARVLFGGQEVILSAGTVSNATLSAGELDLLAGAITSGGITFSGGVGGILAIYGSSMPAAVISGFSGGSHILLNDAAYTPGEGTVSLGANHVLEVDEDGGKFDRPLTGPARA